MSGDPINDAALRLGSKLRLALGESPGLRLRCASCGEVFYEIGIAEDGRQFHTIHNPAYTWVSSREAVVPVCLNNPDCRLALEVRNAAKWWEPLR